MRRSRWITGPVVPAICVIVVPACLLSWLVARGAGNLPWGYVQQPDPAQVRRDELRAAERRQVEEERMLRLKYDELIHAGRGILYPEGRGIPELEQAQTIILVRVIKRDPLTFEVLKSWKGPFSPGRVVHVKPPSGAIVGCVGCPDPRRASWQHAIQGGADELLIFTFATHADEIQPGWAWAGAEARELMRVLDQSASSGST